MRPISKSSLETLDTCPRRFAAGYLEHRRGEAFDPHSAELGTLIHAVLEDATRAVIAGAPWPAATPERRALLLGALKVRAPAPAITREAAALLRAVAPAIDLSSAIDAEHEIAEGWRLRTPLGDVPVRGVIDRVDRRLHGRGPRIIDYKSGHAVLTRTELEEDLQAGIYLCYAREEIADGEPVSARWIYLARGIEVDVEWSAELDAYVRRQVGERWRRIEELRERPVAEWPATPGDGCRGCPLLTECPDAHAAVDLPAEGVRAVDERQIMELRRRAQLAEKIAEALRSACDKVLKPRVIEAGGKLADKSLGYSIVLASRSSADYEDRDATILGLADAAEVHPDEVRAAVTAVDARAVDRWIADLPPAQRARAQSAAVALANFGATQHLQGRALKSATEEAF